MTVGDHRTEGELRTLAFAKTQRVLGPDRGRQLLEGLLAELKSELRTPDDLLRLSQAMAKLGGMEAAVGAMLGVAAIMRGAGEPTTT